MTLQNKDFTLKENKTVFDNGFFKIQNKVVSAPYLKEDLQRSIVQKKNAVSIAYIKKGDDDSVQILISDEYRGGLDKVDFALPAGHIEFGDPDIRAAAIRELTEETGYETNYENAEQILEIASSPGFTTEKVYVVLIKESDSDFNNGKFDFDHDEYVEHLWVTLKTAYEYVINGKITSAPSVAAILDLVIKEKDGKL